MTEQRDSRFAVEVKKLPRSKCQVCGLEGPKPMVRDGKCVNEQACDRRLELLERHRAKGGK